LQKSGGINIFKRLLIRIIGSSILILSLGCLLLASYGNVIRRPYPQLGKKISWALGKPEAAYNFGVVEEGHLYRSSLPDDRFMRFLTKKYKITRVISLRHAPLPYEQAAKELGIDLHIFIWSSTTPHTDPQEIEKVLALMCDQKHVVLVHCGAGADRTGYVVARYRILGQNWPLKEALKEMNGFWHSKENVYGKALEAEFGNH
jgi:protein tyrosine/serine phosphatase